MDAIRIELCAYTASFRVPGMMGYQITSTVPPPTTIFGLIAAATGRDVAPSEIWIAYRFEYEAQAEDLEKLIGFFAGGPVWDNKLNAVNSYPVKRQFLYGARLVLFLPPGEVAESFRRPRYPLVLGRSQDVAYVDSINETELVPVIDGKIRGVLVPFPMSGIRSQIFSFPTYFPVLSRKALAVKPFHAVDWLKGDQKVSAPNLLFLDRKSGDKLSVPMFTERVLSR